MGQYSKYHYDGIEVRIRPLNQRDVREGGFLPLLNQLSRVVTSPEVVIEIASERRGLDYQTLVADIDRLRVIATASYFVEPKLQGRLVGHVEDVVVDEAYRGKGVGRAMVERCILELTNRGCRKVILNCSDENVAFYKKLGFAHTSNQMRLDLD